MAGNDAASASFLICRCNQRLCALPLAHVAETMRPLPVESIPDMPPFLLGVSIIRGALVPVVNVAQLVGATSHDEPARYVTLKVDERQVALAVEGVVGVRELPPASVDEIPPLLRDSGSDLISAITTLDAELLVVLQGARLISEPVWRTIDTQAVPP